MSCCHVARSVTYHDLLHTEGPVSRLEMFLNPGEIVRQFSVLVSVSRDNISQTLVTAPVLGNYNFYRETAGCPQPP